jgi:hypothetical protein
MKKEALSSFETLISISQTTRRHTPKTIFLKSEKMISNNQAYSMSNRFFVTVKGKGKVHPRTGHEGPKGE